MFLVEMIKSVSQVQCAVSGDQCPVSGVTGAVPRTSHLAHLGGCVGVLLPHEVLGDDLAVKQMDDAVAVFGVGR